MKIHEEDEMRKESLRTMLFVLVFVLVGSVTMGRAAPAQSGLTKIADNVYSYVNVKGSSPQNSFGANAGIIIGKNGILVVDTLVSSKEAKRFIKDIRAISDKPIRYVVNTHSHLDHTFGNADFRRLGAVIISHENCKKNMESNSENALKNAKAYGLTEKDMEGTKIVYPVLTFSERMEVDLGNQKVELIYAGPSHTDDSILVYLPDKKILFAGDVLFTGYHPYMGDGEIEGWTEVLDSIAALDPAVIIPGHGPVSGKKDVEDMRNYLITFDEKARELATQSNDVEHIASEIKKIVPQRAEGDWLIKANIQMKYLKK